MAVYQDLQGKVAVITGAGRRDGLGEAMAKRLANEGVKVVLTDIGRTGDEGLPASELGSSDEMAAIPSAGSIH